jgi:TM2 domain-containing membrane protein YozV
MGYYIFQNNETKGPYTLNQLKNMWNAGTITSNLQYCEEGQSGRFPLSDLQPMLEPEQQRLSPQSQRLVQQSAQLVRPAKSRGIYIILGLFLGCLGIHNFYAGYHGRGAAQLIITILLGWLVVGIIITGIWALIEICSVTEDGNGDKMT